LPARAAILPETPLPGADIGAMAKTSEGIARHEGVLGKSPPSLGRWRFASPRR
jgi:hypothetical protein